MNYLHTYNDFIEESILPFNKEEIKRTIKNITDKNKLKEYISSLFKRAEKMNKKIKKVFIYSVIAIVTSLATISLDKNELLEIAKNTSNDIEYYVTYSLMKGLDKSKETNKYLTAIADSESSNRPYIVNRLGYIGKYQFHNLALVDAGVVKNKTEASKFRKKFISLSNEDRLKMWSEEDQDKAMLNYLQKNKHYLRNYSDYIGKTINGIEINWSGLLSAAHLAGQKHVKSYLKSNGKTDYADANGVKVSDYLSKFSKYNISI